MQVLVISPMQEELDYLLSVVADHGYGSRNDAMGKLPIVQIPGLELTFARGGTGKAQFAVQTQHLLDTCPGLGLAILAGAAGGLVKDVSIGDVVVATTTIEHDYGNRFDSRPLPIFEGEKRAIASLKRLSIQPYAFRFHFGPVASGDEDVVELERRKALHERTEALAVAWEGAGGARACQFSEVAFIEMRAITDHANDTAAADFKNNLELAMKNLGSLIIEWIENERKKGTS